MAKTVIEQLSGERREEYKRQGFTEFYMMSDIHANDTSKQGDDERCPVCGETLDCYQDLSFADRMVQLYYCCPGCEADLTFNYWLTAVVAE